MAPNSRGFGGRRRDGIDPSRIPPGQYYERGFPVLSAGPTDAAKRRWRSGSPASLFPARDEAAFSGTLLWAVKDSNLRPRD